jgi:ABC-type branched-subunit amino acid transport system substrate-binding protein
VRHSAKVVAVGVIATALLATTAVLAAGAARAPHGAAGTVRWPHGAPGVTATKVNVGAIVTQGGGALAADFAPYLSGVNAYFDWVNATGGVHGRQLDLAYPLNDSANPQTDITDAETLVNADHAFAIVGVSTPFFNAHTYLASQPIPVFGYATGNVWKTAKNLFADYGSVLNYNSSIAQFAYVAKRTKGSTPIRAAVIALSFPSSKDECLGAVKGLKAYHVPVVYSNVNESVTANWSIEADHLRLHTVNLVINCMDENSDLSLSKAMATYNMSPKQLWLDGYDRSFLGASTNATYMKNVYLMLQHVPFEAATVYPTAFPGLNLYFKEMVAFGFSADEYSETALAGWESANLFTQGLRAAGTSPTQAKVVAAINKITKDLGGPSGGVAPPTNWTIAHKGNTSPACETYVKVVGTAFQLAFNRGAHPWVCFPLPPAVANLSKPVAPPKGTPGA